MIYYYCRFLYPTVAIKHLELKLNEFAMTGCYFFYYEYNNDLIANIKSVQFTFEIVFIDADENFTHISIVKTSKCTYAKSLESFPWYFTTRLT